MRDDIKQLLDKRPSWILHADVEYQNILSAIEYAKQHNNKDALEELEQLLEQRRQYLLEF